MNSSEFTVSRKILASFTNFGFVIKHLLDGGKKCRIIKKLSVWQKSHALTLQVYKITSLFLKEEIYRLTNQLRRASVSIPANIVKGCGRRGNGELLHFLQIAMGSANELEYQLLLAHDLKYYPEEAYKQVTPLLIEVKRMLTGLIKKIKSEIGK